MEPRQLAIGLARFVTENPDRELKGECLAAIIYRLRVVDNYTSNDVDLICDAMRILICKLVELPPVTFAPEVWLPIMTAISEGGIEPQWSTMMESIEVSQFVPTPSFETAGSSVSSASSIVSQNSSTKCSEQITSICREHVLELGLVRRLFSAIWDTNLEDTMKKMMIQDWDGVKIKTTPESGSQANGIFEKNIFDLFAEMKNHEVFAKELYFASLARVLKRLQEHSTPSHDAEDVSFYESPFHVFDELIKKIWSYIFKDESVKTSTLRIFDKLLSLPNTNALIQKVAEKLTDTCEWLKINGTEICSMMEPRLWIVVESLFLRMLELKKSIPYEIVSYAIAVHITQEVTLASPEEDPEGAEKICELLPSGNKKERFLRYMVDTTRSTFVQFIRILRTARDTEKVVNFMRTRWSELMGNSEKAICEVALVMFKNSIHNESITYDDQISIIAEIIRTSAMPNIMSVVDCMDDPKVVKDVVYRILVRVACDLEEGDEKRKVYAKNLHDSKPFWSYVAKHADSEILETVAKQLAFVGATHSDVSRSFLAVDMFLKLLKLPLQSQPSTDQVFCNFDFSCLQIIPDLWKEIGNVLVNVSMTHRTNDASLLLFSLHQLQTVDLPMPELIYVVTNMKFMNTVEGFETHNKFYATVKNVEGILENFISKDHRVALCCQLLKELARIIAANEKSLIFELDHENILDWLKELDVLSSPKIMDKLVDICYSMEIWDTELLLQLETVSCSYHDLQTFGRFWKTTVMTSMEDDVQKKLEDVMVHILKEQYDKQGQIMKRGRERRFNGKFPNRPKIEAWEEQLILMHNRVSGYLVSKKVEEFADESTERYRWLVGVCSGQMSYSKEVFTDAKKIFSRLHPDAGKRKDILYHFGVASVLNGVANDAEVKGELSMRMFFMNCYIEILLSDMVKWKEEDSLDRIDKRLGGLHEWLDDHSEEKVEADKGIHMSVVFRLAIIFWDKRKISRKSSENGEGLKGETPEHVLLTIRKFVGVIASKLDILSYWMLPSLQPYYFVAKFNQLFELIFSCPDIVAQNRKVLETFFAKIFEQLVLPEYLEGLISHDAFIVQCTDKYLSSSLITKRDYEAKFSLQNDLFKVSDIMLLFSKFGSETVQINCLSQMKEHLKPILLNIIENEDILKGEEKIETNEQKRIVCDVTLLTEFLGYFSCLHSHVIQQSKVPDENVIKAFMLLDSEANSKIEGCHRSHSRHRHESLDMNYCTYKSTGGSFANQHWYNCYTCSMMDSTGVCSTCAVNCHRGHDLSYSKKGAFFCDCGSQNCSALEGIEHYPNSMNALRGQLPDENAQKTTRKTKRVFDYVFNNLSNQEETENLKNMILTVKEEFENNREKLERILESIDQGNRNALQVTKKRRDVVESMKIGANIRVENSENFMEYVDSGHFLPIRRVDLQVQERLSTPKVRDLADVIKLDNGIELLVLIPECVQTCLQLHYMDTRTQLIQGMNSIRTETEPIPFNARRLHVSGNRLVVCGIHEIYALRFSPQGAVIDRAHIKLLENGNSSSMQNNPVVKAQFSDEDDTDRKRKQLIAVSTLQYVRIYDLTLHETHFVEEMVLTTGNVEDVAILNQKDDSIRVLVLSTSGYLYEHVITDCNSDNNSIFLTNVVNTPAMNISGDGVSLHYSKTFNLLFISLESTTYFSPLPEPSTDPHFDWNSLNLKHPVNVWKESSGIIACLSSEKPDLVTYIHPDVGIIRVQTVTSKRPIMTFFLMTSSKNEAVYSILIYPDIPTCEIWQTSWQNVHDLWIEDVPSKRYVVEMVEYKSVPKPLEKEDAVLMAEQCEPIAAVEWSCREIEMFYTHNELNHRLAISQSMPITLVQQTHFTLTARITNSRQIVRMVRVEVEGISGPDSLKINNVVYSVASRGPKMFDLKLSREESMSMDHREITIEVIPKPTQVSVKLKSLRLMGCDRSQMDEIQPIFERQPIMTLPNRFVYGILQYSMLLNDSQWSEEIASSHLCRKFNHPTISELSTKAIVLCNADKKSELFNKIDGAYLREWKCLINWTEECGFIEMRMYYVERLLDRLETIRTRWPLFEKNLKKEFGSVTAFVELMRNEMWKMPLHRCQMMAQAIVKVVFGLLSEGSEESEQLINVFLNTFTDKETYHLSNDMRSAVQETISRFEHSVKEEKKLCNEKKGLIRFKNCGFWPFYGVPRVSVATPETRLVAQITGTLPLNSVEDTKWLEKLISMLLEKLTRSSVPSSSWQHISDSPSYNLSRVLASCLAMCDPKVIGSHFSRLISLIKYDANMVFPLSEPSYANYSLLRSVELLLFVCLEKRGEEKEKGTEKKPYSEMLNGIVHELHKAGIADMCLEILEKVIPHWKERGPSTFSKSSEENRKVWLPHVPLISSSANPPNTTILTWPSNSEDAYIIACTDLALLIPQHLQELERRRPPPRDDRWIQKLCKLGSLSSGCSAYRQCKKLLLAICHNDESKYKTIKDKYKMQDLLQQLVQKYMTVSREVGGHQQLTEIVDLLASITKLALNRPDMWRDVCSAYTIWLLRLACFTTDVVASQVVELLIVAVRDSSVGGQLSIQLADSILEAQNGDFIEKIIKRFLIGKDEQLRWTTHGMLRSVIQYASRQNQCLIVKKLYNTIYPMTRNMGIQGAQLVDLISSYVPRIFNSSELVAMAQSEIATIQEISQQLDSEGYQGMYRLMTELGLGWKSIQFDRSPCLVCFTSKGSHECVKMASIRADTRYSANTIIYKLISNYEVSKVIIRLQDVKKSKTVKRVSLYYSTKSVESVDLKLHPELWRKCAVVSVAENETTINLSLAVPVVTSSLVVEFDQVSDHRGSSQLHCPRCSGPVRSHSGVCESCGENAFQCAKCRSINYVEKEPFLCQNCGFCKYAKIELSAVCKALPGAQHITCDAERGQCVQEMTQLLTKMETTKTKLAGYKAVCESLYLKCRPLPPYKLHVENNHASEFFTVNGSMSIEQLAFQSITGPMNNLASGIRDLHNDLCQQTQQLIYLHEELNRYDHSSEVSVVFYKPQNTSYYSTSQSCFGCLCNQIHHSIALLHSTCDDENAVAVMTSSDFICDKLGVLGQNYEVLREEVEELLIRLMFGRADVTTRIEKLIQSGDVNLSVIVKSLGYAADPTWQQKLKLLVRFAIEKRDENSCLQALVVLNKYLEATKSVPAEERKKTKFTSKSSIIKWLTTDEDWQSCCLIASTSKEKIPSIPSNPYQWITECLFSQWMSVRSAANQLLVSLSRQQFHEPVALMILCENLSNLHTAPSSVCDQFMSAAHNIIDSSVNTKARLFVNQFHVYLIKRIHEECASLHEQSISLLSDNSFGERLRCFVELLSLLLSGSNVENVLLKAGADDLLIFLLHSTIFLKRMMTRRTRAIDSSRMALEKLLRRVSCRDGTKLMEVCVESLKLVKDSSTLGIVVGVMMEIMNPQQEAEESFLIQIEKDVAQEDFLQGRMTHNPYNSEDPGMGPLMRDIKNKICRDTEMIALMEDDNGMELLVSGNIISLSLSVRDVYDRLWKRSSNGAPMLIIYRMRGLMGDAVETFIENFGVTEGVSDEDEEDEQLVKMIQSLVKCGGLDKLMDLLSTDIDSSSGRFLLAHLRKIFDRIVKTSSGRKSLVERKMVERMMSVIRTCCEDPTNESKVLIGMELYKVIEFVVSDKNVQESLSGIREEDAKWWFDLFEKRGNEEGFITELHRKTAQILDQMNANIGNIVLGSDASEKVFVGIFPKVLKWANVDSESGSSDLHHAGRNRFSKRDQTILMTEQLAVITSNILPSAHGKRLKQKILDSGVISTTCQYLMSHLPNIYQPTESQEWKVFLTRPSLKLILTLLAGLARGHQASQKEIAKTTLALLHRLEQVASDNSIGTLAENVIEALSEDEEVKNRITEVREETRKKKKEIAMVNRAAQLTSLGMKVGSSGEVTVAARNFHNEPSLDETDSLECCICRESVIRGERAAGVYAFAAVDPDSGKTGSVSMMVMVHFECHKNAIRGSGGGRATDEWTRAKLHNAGVKCNVITPIAVGTSTDEAWKEAMQRFESDVGRVSGLAHGLVNRNFVFVDICKLIDRFIHKRSFSSQSEGGGRESNMQYLAILHLLGITLPADAELETESPNHRLVAFLFTELTAESWNDQKNDVLRAGLNDAQTHGVEATWTGFLPTLFTWAFVDAYFNKVIKIAGEDRLEWLREHFSETITKTAAFVEEFDANVLPCEDAAEFCDVTGALLDDINIFVNP